MVLAVGARGEGDGVGGGLQGKQPGMRGCVNAANANGSGGGGQCSRVLVNSPLVASHRAQKKKKKEIACHIHICIIAGGNLFALCVCGVCACVCRCGH